MNYLRQVQRGIDYIEANLDFEITLAKVAKAAGISQWHFQRIFKALTNETLKTYIRSRRLASALDKLIYTDTGILEIALCAGYESQASFTRSFKKAFGLTPGEYRKIGDRSLFLRKAQFDTDYIKHIQQNVSLEPELYTQGAMKLVGLKTSFYGMESDKNSMGQKLPELWDTFMKRFEEIPHVVPGICYGLVRQAEPGSEKLEYFAVVEVTDIEPPEGMVSLELPPIQYAKFTHRGKPEAIDNTVNYIYSNWLIQSGRKHTYGADLEIYGEGYEADSDASVIYYAIPVE